MQQHPESMHHSHPYRVEPLQTCICARCACVLAAEPTRPAVHHMTRQCPRFGGLPGPQQHTEHLAGKQLPGRFWGLSCLRCTTTQQASAPQSHLVCQRVLSCILLQCAALSLTHCQHDHPAWREAHSGKGPKHRVHTRREGG